MLAVRVDLYSLVYAADFKLSYVISFVHLNYFLQVRPYADCDGHDKNQILPKDVPISI